MSSACRRSRLLPRLFLYLSFFSLGTMTAQATNEVQHITLTNVTASQVQIGYGGGTANFAPGDSATTVQAALQSLPGLVNNISVTGSSSAAGSNVAGSATIADANGSGTCNGTDLNHVKDGNFGSAWQPCYYCELRFDYGMTPRAITQVKVWLSTRENTRMTITAGNSLTMSGNGIADGITFYSNPSLTPNDWTANQGQFLHSATFTNTTAYRYYQVSLYQYVAGTVNYAVQEVEMLGGSGGYNGTYDVTFINGKANTNVNQMTSSTTGVSITTNPDGSAVATPTPVPTPVPDPQPAAPIIQSIETRQMTVIVPPRPPGAPTGIRMTLQWLPPGTTTWTVRDGNAHSNLGSGTSIVYSGLSPDTAYCFRACWYDGNQWLSGHVACASTYPDPPALAEPPTFPRRTARTIKVQAPATWPARADSISLYYWRVDPATTPVSAGSISHNAYSPNATITVKPLDPAMGYSFYWRATNRGGSTNGAVASTSTHNLPGVPLAPVFTNIRATRAEVTAQNPLPSDTTSLTLQQREIINEQQQISLNGVPLDAGPLQVGTNGGTATFPVAASAATVASALERLPGIGTGNVSVTSHIGEKRTNSAHTGTVQVSDNNNMNQGAPGNLIDENLATLWRPYYYAVLKFHLGSDQPVQRIQIYATTPNLASLWISAAPHANPYAGVSLTQSVPPAVPVPAAEAPPGVALYMYSFEPPANSSSYGHYEITLPSSYGISYGIAEVKLLGPPAYSGHYLVEFQRALTAQNVDQLQAISPASIATSTVRNGGVGDWISDPAVLTGVQAGQTHTITGLNPLTSYEMRWVAIGYPEDIDGKTPGDPEIFTTTEIEVDALIRNVGETDFIGDHIHNLDGTDQTKQQWALSGNAAEYEVLIKNRAPVSQGAIKVTGPGSDDNWDVSYFDEQGNNLTHMITGAGWNIASLNAGASRVITVEVAPNTAAPVGAAKEVLVKATITDDEVQADAVLASTTAVDQMIQKLQYSLDEGTTWMDVPQPGAANYPLTVDQHTAVDFKAIKANPNAEWPDGEPFWLSDEELDDMGEVATVYFEDYSQDANDLLSVTAECNNQVTAYVKVNPRSAVYVWTDVDAILAGGISDLAQTTVYAAVEDKDGNPVPGAIVQFNPQYDATQAQAGEINGTGTIDDTAITNAMGVASVTLTSGSELGDVLLKVTTADDRGNLVDQWPVTFEPPIAKVSFGQWIHDGNGNRHQTVTIVATYYDDPVPNLPVGLHLNVTDAETGQQASADYQNAVSLITPNGITNTSGIYSTTLRWMPPLGEPQIGPGKYNISVIVNATSITN